MILILFHLEIYLWMMLSVILLGFLLFISLILVLFVSAFFLLFSLSLFSFLFIFFNVCGFLLFLFGWGFFLFFLLPKEIKNRIINIQNMMTIRQVFCGLSLFSYLQSQWELTFPLFSLL